MIGLIKGDTGSLVYDSYCGTKDYMLGLYSTGICGLSRATCPEALNI